MTNFYETITDLIGTEKASELNDWFAAQAAKAIDKQKEDIKEDHEDYDLYSMFWENGAPYSGFIGGAYTYKITPTSVGMIVMVENALTGDIINVTDWDNF